jgi:predicted ATP-dependent serine protease
MIFQQRLDSLIEAKKNKDSGLLNCIPFYDAYPRLSNYLPGIIKGVYYIVSANSGIGKTQLTKHMFVLTPYRFVKNHPESKLKLKILYFALEESKEEFIDSLIVAHLFEKYNISIDTLELRSMFKTSLNQNIIDKINESKEYFQDLFNCVEVIDSVSNPTGRQEKY